MASSGGTPGTTDTTSFQLFSLPVRRRQPHQSDPERALSPPLGCNLAQAETLRTTLEGASLYNEFRVKLRRREPSWVEQSNTSAKCFANSLPVSYTIPGLLEIPQEQTIELEGAVSPQRGTGRINTCAANPNRSGGPPPVL